MIPRGMSQFKKERGGGEGGGKLYAPPLHPSAVRLSSPLSLQDMRAQGYTGRIMAVSAKMFECPAFRATANISASRRSSSFSRAGATGCGGFLPVLCLDLMRFSCKFLINLAL